MDENTAASNKSDAEQSKRYIRTFAGDMETLKKGGAPELAPLGEHPAPKEIPAPPPEAPEESAPPVLAPEFVQEIPSPPVVLRPLTPASPPSPPVATLKTYAGDFSERMKETHASATTVLAAEQDSGPALVQSSQEAPSPRNMWYIGAGVILLLVGAVGAYIAYTQYQTALEPVALVPSVSAPIFVDERKQISNNGLAPLVAIQQSIAEPLARNAVRLLYMATTSDKSLFSSLPVSAPDILSRNVNVQGSMTGIVHVGDVQSPFFILSVLSYGDTFSGMLSWEPRMPRMLVALFPPYPQTYAPAATTTPSTVTSVTATTPGFYDEVVGNHDVRVYRDQAGRSVMLYGYWNQTTLVIARDPAAFTEILGRLATARAQN